MVEKYDSIIQNCVLDVVPRPQYKSVVSSRWLYKVTQVADGSVEKHKARFVARGFSDVKGIDNDETFDPVARYSSIRSMLALSARWVGRYIRWMQTLCSSMAQLRKRCTLSSRKDLRPSIMSHMCAYSRELCTG